MLPNGDDITSVDVADKLNFVYIGETEAVYCILTSVSGGWAPANQQIIVIGDLGSDEKPISHLWCIICTSAHMYSLIAYTCM